MDPNQPQPERPRPQPTPTTPNTPIVGPEVEPATSPVAPSALDTPSQPTEFQPIQLQPTQPKKSRRKLWIIIVSIIIVLLGAAAAAYQFWYQHPEKVITDGIVHALKAKTTTYTGSVTYASDLGTMKLSVDGVYDAGAQNLNANLAMTHQGQEFSVKGSVLVDKNSDLYVRLSNLDTVFESYLSDLPAETRANIDKIIAKVNGQWVKIEATELAAYNQTWSRSQTCWSNAVQQTENHAGFLEEIASIYQKNKFMAVTEQLAQQEGSFGYVLATDPAKTVAFVRELKNTQAYKTLHECDASFEINESDFGTASDGAAYRNEVWVGMFNHQITKVTSTMTEGSDKGTLEVRPVFNQPVSVTAPEKSTTLKQLQADIEAVIKDIQQAQMRQQGAGSGQSIDDDPFAT